MHIHAGIIHAISAFLGVIIVGFFWRVIAAHNSDNAIGQGMAFVY
jgi:hypothetical protein